MKVNLCQVREMYARMFPASYRSDKPLRIKPSVHWGPTLRSPSHPKTLTPPDTEDFANILLTFSCEKLKGFPKS